MATMKIYQRIFCCAVLMHIFWITNGHTESTKEEEEETHILRVTSPVANVSEDGKETQALTHKPTINEESLLVTEETLGIHKLSENDTNYMLANASRRHSYSSIASEEIDKAIDSKHKNKDIMRYGRQHLNLCKNFEKQDSCSRKCLETGFDEGRTDKNCSCICYKEKNFNIYTATEKKEKVTTTTEGKVILRYGIHKLSVCKDYAKQYICTRKCIDTGFDEGRTDKDCHCSCYKIEDFKQYTPPRRRNMTKWMSGAPRTTIPFRAGPKITTANVNKGGTLGAFRCDYTFNASADGWFKLHYMMNWTDANATCSREGAEVVAPNSKALKEAVLAIIQLEGLEGIHTARRVLGQPQQKQDQASKNETNATTVQYDSLSEILLPTGFYKTGSKSDFYPYICFKKSPELMQVTECGTVDRGYKRADDRCFKFHPTFATWCDALRICVAEGAFLIIISKQEDLKPLKKLLANDWNDFYNEHENETVNKDAAKKAFVGIWSTNSGGTWITLRGGLVSATHYNKWHPGLPSTNETGNNFCGKIDKKELSYHDEPCDSYAPFICEKSLSSSDICDNPITKPKLDAIFRKCSMYFGM